MDTRRPTRSVRSRASYSATIIAFVGCTGAELASAATYYVSTSGHDRNPGSPMAPWRTLQKAMNTMVGGDKTIVLAGKYNEMVNTVRSGTDGHRIAMKAAGQVVTKTFDIAHQYIRTFLLD